MKRSLTLWINAPLIERLDSRARLDGRNRINLVEQALAEYLNVPVANRDLPQQPVELCGNCERGVLNEGRCGDCGWHRLTRQEQWAHDRQLRAQKKRQQKPTKPEAA